MAVVSGLFVLGLLALGQLTIELSIDPNTHRVDVQVTSVGETAWFLVWVVLEGLVGPLLLLAAAHLISSREWLGSALGYFVLLFSITALRERASD